MYIYKFNEYASENYQSTKDMISEFKSKKGTLESIFSKDLTILEIDSQILTKVFGNDKKNQNPILIKYSNILKIRRKLDLIDNETIEDGKRKSDLKLNIHKLRNQSMEFPESVDYYDQEISKIEDSIKKIDKRVSDRVKEVSRIQTTLSRENVDFKKMIAEYSKSISGLDKK